MRTRATVALKKRNGEVESIYVHSGKLTILGATLLDSFTQESKIQKMIDYGNASFIGADIDTPNGKKEDGENSYFYVRDERRSLSNEGKETFSSVEELFDFVEGSDSDYLYLYDSSKKKWYYSESEDFTNLLPLVIKESFNEGVMDFNTFINEGKMATISADEVETMMGKYSNLPVKVSVTTKKYRSSHSVSFDKSYTIISLKGKGIIHEISDNGLGKGMKYRLTMRQGVSKELDDLLINDKVPNAINHGELYYSSLKNAILGSCKIIQDFINQ